MHFAGGPAQLRPGQGSPRLLPARRGPRAPPSPPAPAAGTPSGPGLCPAGLGPRAALTSAGLRSLRACAEPDKWWCRRREWRELLGELTGERAGHRDLWAQRRRPRPDLTRTLHRSPPLPGGRARSGRPTRRRRLFTLGAVRVRRGSRMGLPRRPPVICGPHSRVAPLPPPPSSPTPVAPGIAVSHC
ncbi:homeobox protein MIXL1-like [Zalophus californianus]|uniref:Homeobox protein MIXL1-like n=1 Tax=Zalophus californianus TaxID=9704 RepID=A0A6J2D5M0_ZALCA|nr:homeobox protein MIXL1-like [Zalophus californianus]XP_027971449.1 homeobox protein MIXL1-like [Eumetopias jubatus]